MYTMHFLNAYIIIQADHRNHPDYPDHLTTWPPREWQFTKFKKSLSRTTIHKKWFGTTDCTKGCHPLANKSSETIFGMSGTTIYTKVGQSYNMQTLQKIRIGTDFLQKVLEMIESKLINSELTLTVGACFHCLSIEDIFHFCFPSKNFC